MKQLHQPVNLTRAVDNPLWHSLTASEQRTLPQHASIFIYAPNEVIYREGDEVSHVFVILEGKMKLFKKGVGQQQILTILTPFDLTGHRAIIANEHCAVNAMALDNLMVLAIDKKFFIDLLKTNINICHICLQNLANSVSYYAIKSINLSQKHVRSRLAETLISLVAKHGYEPDGITIRIYLSREELANMSNMNAANAIRTLSAFMKEHIIIVDGRKIKVLDEEELRRISTSGE